MPRKFLVGMGDVLANLVSELVGNWIGINPKKVPTQQHIKPCRFQPKSNWNKANIYIYISVCYSVFILLSLNFRFVYLRFSSFLFYWLQFLVDFKLARNCFLIFRKKYLKVCYDMGILPRKYFFIAFF